MLEERHRRPPPAPATVRNSGWLVDSHGRRIRDLRLSVTDRCNFRCVYCLEPDVRFLPKMELLTLAEYLRVVRLMQGLGIEKVRLTGGEPTLYPHLDDLIEALGGAGLRDLAMTTNGSLVDADRAAAWRVKGLRRLTVSLDTLREDRMVSLTRSRTSAASVLEAVTAARDAGLEPVKVNCVVIRGFNDDEVADFADLARALAVTVRLIEFMPLDAGHRWNRRHVVGADEMLAAIEARHVLVPLEPAHPSSTSSTWAFADGAPGRIGIIAPVTRPFCGACNRLRITSEGMVRPCLFSRDEWDLRPLLRGDADDAAITAFIADSTWTKQAGHGIGAEDFVQPQRTMSAIGG